MVTAFIIGGVVLLFGLLLIFDRKHFSDRFKQAVPLPFRELVSDERARMVPVLGGVTFVFFGVLVAVLGFFLVPTGA